MSVSQKAKLARQVLQAIQQQLVGEGVPPCQEQPTAELVESAQTEDLAFLELQRRFASRLYGVLDHAAASGTLVLRWPTDNTGPPMQIAYQRVFMEALLSQGAPEHFTLRMVRSLRNHIPGLEVPWEIEFFRRHLIYEMGYAIARPLEIVDDLRLESDDPDTVVAELARRLNTSERKAVRAFNNNVHRLRKHLTGEHISGLTGGRYSLDELFHGK